MPSRAHDWFAQAERDLAHARYSLGVGHYEWACFAAHQAAEKALKAVYQSLGPWGATPEDTTSTVYWTVW